jgi:adenylate cyclase, class 2
MAAPKEVEVKVLVDDLKRLEQKLRDSGFRQVTPATLERNTLYDLRLRPLRRKGQVLRLRKYGDIWKLTHKSRDVKRGASTPKHKTRIENETKVENGERMDAILRALGYSPVFVYEKFRAEWTDGDGHVVLDHTPIGDLAEIEGSPKWIDATARKLSIKGNTYITKSYIEMFFDWKKRTRSRAKQMTFAECGTSS